MNSMSNRFNRRTLVRTGALAAVACGLPATSFPGIAQSAPASSPIKFGVASYTFRNFTRDQMIGFMKQLRLVDLNLKDVKDHLPADPAGEDKALADYAAAGMKLHAAGTIYFAKDEDADVRSKFEYCKRAGIGIIVAGDPTPQTLPRIEKFAKEYDIRIAIHNHGPEDKLWPSPLDILKDVAKLDRRVGCCIDVGHTMRAGTDVLEAIRKVGPRLFNVHMKDLAEKDKKESQVPVGEGIMPIRGIFETLISTGYKGFVDLEYEIHGEDPMPGVIESFSYMRGVLNGMSKA